MQSSSSSSTLYSQVMQKPENIQDYLSCLQRMIRGWNKLVVLSVTLFYLIQFYSVHVYYATVFDVFYYNLQVYQNMKIFFKIYYQINVSTCIHWYWIYLNSAYLVSGSEDTKLLLKDSSNVIENLDSTHTALKKEGLTLYCVPSSNC